MLFDQKIKYLTEVLKKKNPISIPPQPQGTVGQLGGVGKTMAGYQHKEPTRGLGMNEEEFKSSMESFAKSKNPIILNDALVFAEGNPKANFKFDKKNHMASELKDLVIKKYFTAGSKDYIPYPKDKDGVVFRNVDFQREVKRNPSYNIVKTNPVMWLKVLFKLFPVEASDRRQEAGSYAEKVPYFTSNGVRSARVQVIDGKVTRTPFGGRFSYNNKYQAYTPDGKPIPYDSINGGITLDEFKAILHSAKAKAKM